MPSSVTRRALLCGAGGGLAAAAILHRPAHAAEFSYKFASVLPPDHPMMLRCSEAIAKIKDQSGGRFEITLYPNSALGADTSMLAQCVTGAVEMYALQGDLLAPRVPAAGIVGVGFAFPSYKEVWPAIDGELGDFVRAQAEKSNMICLKRAWDHGFREITSRNKPIKSPADLKGFKIRLPVAPYLISLFRHLGAAPTAINFNEVYSALQTGIVDGQENPLVLIDTAKLFEVQKYCSLTNHVWAGFHTSFNVAAWKKLPPDLQEICHRTFSAVAITQRQAFVTMTNNEQQNLTTKGLTFNATDSKPFREVLAKTGFYPDMKKLAGDKPWALLEKYVGPLTS